MRRRRIFRSATTTGLVSTALLSSIALWALSCTPLSVRSMQWKILVIECVGAVVTIDGALTVSVTRCERCRRYDTRECHCWENLGCFAGVPWATPRSPARFGPLEVDHGPFSRASGIRVSLDLWFPTLVLGLLLANRLFSHYREMRREGICDQCGYDLTGNVSGNCPECGINVLPTLVPAVAASKDLPVDGVIKGPSNRPLRQRTQPFTVTP